MLADDSTVRHAAIGEKRLRADQHTGRAEAALQGVARAERLLQIGNHPGIRDALDGFDIGTIALHGKDEAAANHLPVDLYRAGAADAVLAADMAAGQAEIVAQEIDQRFARL